MKTVFLVYETDRNLMKSSRVLVAACTSLKSAVTVVINELHKNGLITTAEFGNVRNILKEQKQTQNYDENFFIDEIELNKILN